MSSSKSKGKVAEIVKLLSLIPVRSPKKILEKSKFFGKGKKSMKQSILMSGSCMLR